METIPIKRTWYDRLTHWLSLACLAGAGLYLLVNWQNIPETIPTHFDFAGQPDDWGSRITCLVVLAIGAAIWAVTAALGRFPALWNTGVAVTEENQRRVYRILKNMLSTLKLTAAVILAFLAVYPTRGQALPGLFLPLACLAVLGPLAFFCWQLYRSR